MSTRKHFNRMTAALMIFFGALFLLTFFVHSEIQAYEEKQGIVNGTYVNVRTGAGTSNDKLTYQGNNVQLNVGESVIIIGESNAADGATWYKIKFNYRNAELTGYIHSAYVDVEVTGYATDEDFEKYLTEQGFPESYKGKLRVLHAKYPKWVFQADKIAYDWQEVLAGESQIGRSLVSKNSISSWKSLENGSYNWSTGQWATFDGGSWVAASEEYIAYCLDPRNFLDERYIFQFELLSFNAAIHKEENVKKLLAGTFMENGQSVTGKTFETTFMEAAAQSGVSPYHLVARVIQEVGYQGTTGGVTGYYAPSTGNVYQNLYNFYNIGAYAASGRGAVENGLIYASKTDEENLRPWNTKYKAIVGGAIFIGKGYINIGQDTIYYEKFDLVGSPYTHQYMTNVQAPKSEASKMANAYTEQMKKDIALIFKIPVYQNMPAETCTCPTMDGSPNNILEDITVNGYTLTPTFNKFTKEYDLVVPNSVSSIGISATALDSAAKIKGAGTVSLNVGMNTVNIVVTAGNGNTRTYTLNVVRSSAAGTTEPVTQPVTQPTTKKTTQPPTQPATQPTTQSSTQMTTPKPTTAPVISQDPAQLSYTTTYRIVDGTYLTGLEAGTTVEKVKASFHLNQCTIAFYKANGTAMTSGKVGSGTVIKISDTKGSQLRQFTCLLYGDINGDGNIDLVDMLYQKRHILGIAPLNGVRLLAGDINKKGGIDLVDMLYVKRYILRIGSIPQ